MVHITAVQVHLSLPDLFRPLLLSKPPPPAPHWLCQRRWSHGGNEDHPSRTDALRHCWVAFPLLGVFSRRIPNGQGARAGAAIQDAGPVRDQGRTATRRAPSAGYVALSMEESDKRIALTPLPRDKELLAILGRIDAGITSNTAAKRGIADFETAQFSQTLRRICRSWFRLMSHKPELRT